MSTFGIWMTEGKSEVYQWYLDDYWKSLRSISSTCMTSVKSEAYQWNLNYYMLSLKSTSGVCMTIGIVLGLPLVY